MAFSLPASLQKDRAGSLWVGSLIRGRLCWLGAAPGQAQHQQHPQVTLVPLSQPRLAGLFQQSFFQRGHSLTARAAINPSGAAALLLPHLQTCRAVENPGNPHLDVPVPQHGTPHCQGMLQAEEWERFQQEL